MKKLLPWALVAALGASVMISTVAVPAQAAGPAPVTDVPSASWGVYRAGSSAAENYASVYSVMRTTDHIYLAGNFTSLISSDGTQTVPAGNIAALNLDGTPDLSFSISANGVVRKIALGPDGALYLGGAFTSVADGSGAQYHPHLARILPGGTTVDASWSPSVTGTNAVVYALAFSPVPSTPAAVYVGGTFSTAKQYSSAPTSSPRTNAAAFSATDASVLPWAPVADNANDPTDPHGPSVRDILLDTATKPGTTRVYIAGEFDEVNQNTKIRGVALVTPDTGALVLNSYGAVAFVAPFQLCNDGLGLAMGTFGTAQTPALWLADGGQCNGLYALAPGTGKQYKKIQSDGDVQAVAVQGNYVYVGGHMTTFDNVAHVHTARVAMATGVSDSSWSPAMNPSYSPYFFGVWSVFAYTDPAGTYYLYEAGVFKTVSGVAQPKFTWFTNGTVAVPGAPTGVTATAGDSSATVSWNRPADGGAPISSYTVTATPGGKTTTVSGSPPVTSATLTGLANGTSYTFTVTATNRVGTGPPSAPSNAVTPNGVPNSVPSAPTGVTATAGDTTADVTWTPPTSNGGSAITTYTVTANPGPASATVTGSPPATSATVTGLLNGVAYTFTVTATNAVGTGPASDPSNSVTPSTGGQCGPPGAPRYDLSAPPSALSVDATPTVPGVTAWAGATGSGCTYELQQQTSAGSWSTVFSGSATSYNIALPLGGPYNFQVRSIDANGASSAWVGGTPFTVGGGQETDPAVSYTGTFSAPSNTGYWGGAAASTVTLNDSATVTFTGRSFALVGIKCPACGAIQVYVDGAKAGQVTEYGSTTQYRRIIYTKNWSSASTHTVKIVNLATSGHAKMLLDGFATLS